MQWSTLKLAAEMLFFRNIQIRPAYLAVRTRGNKEMLVLRYQNWYVNGPTDSSSNITIENERHAHDASQEGTMQVLWSLSTNMTEHNLTKVYFI